jgi:hypothetical protein
LVCAKKWKKSASKAGGQRDEPMSDHARKAETKL